MESTFTTQDDSFLKLLSHFTHFVAQNPSPYWKLSFDVESLISAPVHKELLVQPTPVIIAPSDELRDQLIDAIAETPFGGELRLVIRTVRRTDFIFMMPSYAGASK